MQRLLRGLVMGLSMVWLAACRQQNPALHVDSDTLAKAINTFENQSIGNLYVGSCGIFYATDNPRLNEPDAQQECHHYCERLTAFLNQQPEFKTLTVAQCETKAIWKHYFQSKKAYARGDVVVKPE